MFALKNFVGKQGKHHLSGATNLKGRLLFCFCFVERLKQGEMSNGYTGYTPPPLVFLHCGGTKIIAQFPLQFQDLG